MKIISKYVLKEHAGPLVFALTALTSLLLLNYIAKQFGELVGKGLPWQAILQFFLLSIPFTFAMTVPMAVLVAVLFAFSRLAAENEITAMRASGVGSATLMVPVLIGGVVVALGMIAFNDQVLPRSNHRLATLQTDILRTKPTFALKEQVMNPVQEGRMYMRASRIAEGSSRLFDVILYDLTDQTRRRTIYADSGRLAFAANGQDLLMTLYHGYMLEVPTANQAQMSRLFFTSNILRFRGVGNRFSQSSPDAEEIGKSDREMTVCEMAKAQIGAEERLNRMKFELDAAKLAAAKDPAAMKPLVPKKFVPGRSWGGMYCSFLTKLAPKAAEAQGVTPAQKPDTTPKADTARKADTTPAPKVDTPVVAQPVPVTPAPVQQQPVPQQPAPGAQPVPMQAVPPGQAVPGQPLPGQMPPPPPVQIPPSAGLPSAGSSSMTAAESRLQDAQNSYNDAKRQVNRYLVEIHKKFALAVACLVFVLIGAPIALRFPRGGVGLVIGVSLAIFGLYYVGLIGGEALADRGLISPVWAMWGTNALMGFFGLVLVARMGREGGTARGGDLGDRFAAWRERRHARKLARARG